MKKIAAALAGTALVIGSVLPVSALAFDYESLAKDVLKSAATTLYNEYQDSVDTTAGSTADTTASSTAGSNSTFTPKDVAWYINVDPSLTPAGMESLDPLPPLDPSKMPDWFDARTFPEKMTNARLVAEYNALIPYMREHDLFFEAPLCREEELLNEMSHRWDRYDYYQEYAEYEGILEAVNRAVNRAKNDELYLRTIASDVTPLREFFGE